MTSARAWLGAAALAATAAAAMRAGPAGAMGGDYESAAIRIEVRLAERVGSNDAKPGALFRFDTTSSVMIAGRFLPAQTHGHGVVVAARPARPGKPGALVLAARSLDPSDGEPVEVGLEPGQLSAAAHAAADVSFEAGTRFFVDAPPPPSPAPT